MTTTTMSWEVKGRGLKQKLKKFLHPSGGKLELSKCFTYHLKCEEDSEGNQVMKKEKEIMELQDSEEGERVLIEAKQVNEAHKTLEFHKSPDMSMAKQLFFIFYFGVYLF